jgi:hypothetical protein
MPSWRGAVIPTWIPPAPRTWKSRGGVYIASTSTTPEFTAREIVESLNAVYAYVYDAPPSLTEKAARLRVEAMDLSDDWVQAGCDRADPRLAVEGRALVASYSALRDATARRAEGSVEG